jgi:predicted DNA-binding transcriptional regulator AlpA
MPQIKTKSKPVPSPVKYSQVLEELRAKDPRAFLSQKRVRELIPLSRVEIFRRYKKKLFPVPFRIGDRSLFWKAGELYKWLEEQQRATDKRMSNPPQQKKKN